MSADLATLETQLRDALARRKAMPSWKSDMTDEVKAARRAVVDEVNALREAIHQVGRPCPDEICSGRVRTYRQTYCDMERCDRCRYSAVMYALGD